MEAAGEVGEREVGRLERREVVRPLGSRRAEDGHALVRVQGKRAIEHARERREIDAVVVHERRLITHQHAGPRPAEAFGLQLPAERGWECVGGEADRVLVKDGLRRHGPAVVDQRERVGRHGSSTIPVRPSTQDDRLPRRGFDARPTHMTTSGDRDEAWPALPLSEWQDTQATLHMWTQIVGKLRVAQTPWVTDSWHVPLYVTSRGLPTSPIPYGTRTFDVDFDFLDHQLLIRTSSGTTRTIPLRPRSVADFYVAVMTALRELGLEVRIRPRPNEVQRAVAFPEDHEHASYDAGSANRFWRILLQSDRVLKAFRARFIGKCSPVHFFWGSFDLAVTRFSGRPAPPHPGGVPNFPDWIAREAYSHEVCSCGFWPGGGAVPMPAYYAYAYPEPNGFRTASVEPAGASYSPELREFILPYDAVRTAAAPDETLLAFLQSTYDAAADLGAWDRAALERTISPRSA